MIIGIDDTDSNEGMCTTYLGAILLEELQMYGTIETLPFLVRLNPSIPYKTRGNAAIALELKTNCPEKVTAYILSRIEELAHMDCEKTIQELFSSWTKNMRILSISSKNF